MKAPKLQIIHRERTKSLRVYKMPKGKRAGIGYKYLVTSFGGTSHTAFRTKKGFDNYIKSHGLRVAKKSGWTGDHKIIGTEINTYYKGTQKQLDALAKKKGWKPTAVLENGEYVRGYIKTNKRGKKEVVCMNVNYKPRKLKYRRP